MPQQCKTCMSPHRATVDALSWEGVSIAEISRRTGLPYQSIKRHVRNDRGPRPDPLATVASVAGPVAIADTAVGTFEQAFDLKAKDYQRDYLTATTDLIWLKGRQVGASQCAAGLAIHVARTQAGSDTVIVSATQRQSSEVAVRARLGLARLGEKLVQDSASVLRLPNGSRILSLAQSARAVRGYSAALLIMDEAAFIEDAVWNAARPMVSATHGRVVIQSTPGVPAGWFHALVKSPPATFAHMRVTSEEAGLATPEFLASERAHLAPHIYAQEYLGQFASSGSLGRWFDEAGFDARVNRDERALDVSLDHMEEA